jgi:histone deacetylase HOS3
LEPQLSPALQWLPHNTDVAPAPPTMGSHPMPPAKKQDLPVFTANSTIPFATPASTTTQQSAPSGNQTDNDKKDVWEVPDTPAH